MLLLWEDLKKHCEAFKDNFHLLHQQFVIINDFEEEEHVKIELHKEKKKLDNLLKLSN